MEAPTTEELLSVPREAVEAQAAEIERLEEELKTARAIYDGSLELLLEQEAQFAEMRAALESIAANTCCDRCQEAALVARQALATTGKEAADVIAAADAFQAQIESDDYDAAEYLDVQVEFRRAVLVYRATMKGRDDA